ncbi:MAG: hypothetical protein WCJ07_01425 [Verrucomicrobiota bacterium]
MSIHNAYRRTVRPNLRRPLRNLNRAGLWGRRRGPDDFAQMLTAYGRAIRAHRRLARLAPSFFDAAVVERERENRAEQRRWMAMWEPILDKAYGVEPEPAVPVNELPPLPPPRIQRAVDRELAELQLWLEAGHVALARYEQRNPHALLSWTRMARCLNLAFDLKKMVLGLDSPNPLPEKITYDYEFTDLKRAYGHLCDSDVSGSATSNPPVAPASVDAPPRRSPPVATPVAGSEVQPSGSDIYHPLPGGCNQAICSCDPAGTTPL